MSAEDKIQSLQEQLSKLQQQQLGANAGEEIYIGQYLLTRLEQLGVSVRLSMLLSIPHCS